MTSGSPTRSIVLFAIPLMAGMVLQRCYNVIDAVIVGQFVGIDALAAMGVVGWPTWMVLNIILEYAAGCSIYIAKCFGGNDIEKFKKSVGMSVLAGIAVAAVITLLMQLLTDPILELLDTPASVYGYAETYLRIYCAGAVFSVAYNLVCAFLRAVGNSRIPMVSMAIATVTNIVLDLLFVIVFHMGIAGTAIATVISQLVATLVCLPAIRRNEYFALRKRHWTPDFSIIAASCRLYLPMMLQGLIISMGGLIVQRVINQYDKEFIAGITSAEQIYAFIEVVSIALRSSLSVFVSQNLGAKQYSRIRRGIGVTVLVGLGVSSALSLGVRIFGPDLLRIFISESDPVTAAETLAVAQGQLSVTCFAILTLFQMYTVRTSLQSLGNTVLPMIAGFIQCLTRIAAALYLPLLLGREGLFYNDLCAHLITIVIVTVGLLLQLRKLETGSDRSVPA